MDLNAAINIKNRAKHAQINACGQESQTDRISPAAWMKQEADSELVYA